MFGKKKHDIDTSSMHGYKEAIKAITLFSASKDWKKTYKAIEEIKTKEKASYDALVAKLSKDDHDINNSAKLKQQKLFKKKMEELEKLKKDATEKEAKYNKIEDEKRFKLRFKKIKKELILLSKTGKHDLAINLLSVFLEENKDKVMVVDFYNKEKKKILVEKEKNKKTEAEKIKKNAKLEALRLIGKTANLDINEVQAKKEEDKKKKKEAWGIFSGLKEKLNFYKKVKLNLEKKKMMDEINLLIDEDSKIKKDLAAKKLESMHQGLIKEINNETILWYDFYGKILGADKISGDTFWFFEAKNKYNFFIGDATGHGIRAWFIVTLISRLFNTNIAKKPLKEAAFEINNWLKQDLKNRNFITAIFYEIMRDALWTIKFVGMGHEPMFVYRAKTKKIEKVIPGWLAAGIRMIKHVEDIAEKNIEMNHGDILITYSDGAVELKNIEGEFYGLDRLISAIEEISKVETDVKKIYAYVMNDLKGFNGWASFTDDMTLLMMRRNSDKDIVDEKDEYLQKISMKEWLNKKETKSLAWKDKQAIDQELEKIRKQKELEWIVKNLNQLYITWEILKLKQEAIRFIKAWFIDKRINILLKKAINNETKYKIEQKEQKVANKYNVLTELLKKWDYQTVITEAENIIAKDGNI